MLRRINKVYIVPEKNKLLKRKPVNGMLAAAYGKVFMGGRSESADAEAIKFLVCNKVTVNLFTFINSIAAIMNRCKLERKHFFH